MGDVRKPRGSDLTPEQREKIAAIRSRPRTNEDFDREEAVRAEFADKPSLAQLIEQGRADPATLTTMGALGVLHKAMAEVRRAREAKGISLTEVARRSGMSLPSLSRLDGGKNANPTFETIARYAAAVGLELAIVVRDPAGAQPEREGPAETARDLELARLRWDFDRLKTFVEKLAGIGDALTVPVAVPGGHEAPEPWHRY